MLNVSANEGQRLDRSVSVLSRSFADDPVMRFLFDGLDRHEERLRQFFTYQAHDAADRFVLDATEYAAAIWRPPGPPSRDSRIPFDVTAVFGADSTQVDAVRAAMTTHHPVEPHWYLFFVGVDPAAAGRGHGRGLVEDRLRQIDREGHACYLEATTLNSARLYERMGFERRQPFAIQGGPTLYPMWRQPQPLLHA